MVRITTGERDNILLHFTEEVMKMNAKQMEVLIVEDNPGDALLISLLLEDTGLQIHTTIAKNGGDALSILSKEEGHPNGTKSDLVILDLTFLLHTASMSLPI